MVYGYKPAAPERLEREIADLTLSHACDQLGITRPPMDFIEACQVDDPASLMARPLPIWGAVMAGETAPRIYILRGLELFEMIAVVAHEARHIYQLVFELPFSEDDAEAFGKKVRAEICR